jgi:hypothetical protein
MEMFEFVIVVASLALAIGLGSLSSISTAVSVLE